MRRIVLLALASVLLGQLAEVPARATPPPFTWCVDVPPPCIESATRNGSSVGSADPDWHVFLSEDPPGGSRDILWQVNSNGHELGSAALSDVWVITFDTGTVIPRLAFTHGTNVTVVRTNDGDGTYHVTITASPVILSSQCDQSVWPWTCPSVPPASEEWVGYLDGQITDYAAWNDASQRASFYGMNYHTNIAATSVPPEIENDPTTGHERILIRLANSHYRADGVTVTTGEAHLRIPNKFLKVVYGIDDPASLTGVGLAPTMSGSGTATISVAPDPAGGALLVDITNVTFSTRLLRIRRGKVTPTRPTDLRARRVDDDTGRLRFGRATKRGSRIVGYQGRCVNGSDVVVANGSGSPLTINGLTPGLSYRCRVRARSKAGPGTWSARDGMPA